MYWLVMVSAGRNKATVAFSRKSNLVFAGVQNVVIISKCTCDDVVTAEINSRLVLATVKAYWLATTSAGARNLVIAHANASKLSLTFVNAFSIVFADKWTRDGANATTFCPSFAQTHAVKPNATPLLSYTHTIAVVLCFTDKDVRPNVHEKSHAQWHKKKRFALNMQAQIRDKIEQ